MAVKLTVNNGAVKLSDLQDRLDNGAISLEGGKYSGFCGGGIRPGPIDQDIYLDLNGFVICLFDVDKDASVEDLKLTVNLD